jgi:hypothetical protein
MIQGIPVVEHSEGAVAGEIKLLWQRISGILKAGEVSSEQKSLKG